MGWRPANWRRLMAFPDTSRMQCLPWTTRVIKLAVSPPSPPSATTLTHLVSHFFNRLDAGSVQMIVVLPSFYEFMLLDLSFHDLPGGNEVVISAVHLVVSTWSCCV